MISRIVIQSIPIYRHVIKQFKTGVAARERVRVLSDTQNVWQTTFDHRKLPIPTHLLVMRSNAQQLVTLDVGHA